MTSVAKTETPVAAKTETPVAAKTETPQQKVETPIAGDVSTPEGESTSITMTPMESRPTKKDLQRAFIDLLFQ